jgi:hypothetical protein
MELNAGLRLERDDPGEYKLIECISPYFPAKDGQLQGDGLNLLRKKKNKKRPSKMIEGPKDP